MKRNFLLTLLFIPFFASSQDLTGIWRGNFKSNNSSVVEKLYGIEDRYKFEVQIDQRNQAFQGVTYSYKTTVFYGKASCKGSVNPKSQKVLLEEIKIVEVRMTDGSDACIMTLFLNYSKNGDEEFMEGTYTSMNTRDSSSCGRGTVFLRKVPQSDFYKEPFLVKREEEALKKKTEAQTKIAKADPPKPPVKKTTAPVTNTNPPAKKTTTTSTTQKKTPPPVVKKQSTSKTTPKDIAKSNPAKSVIIMPQRDSTKDIEKKIPINVPTPKVLANRTNELVKTITVNTTDVVVDLYDNGTIDNDTVSVYLDKKLVVSKQRLTDHPITVKLKLDEGNDYHELVMVAENLGEIPPNTSLMVVKAGEQHFEVRITSTEQKNAVVIFKYEKKD